VFTQIDIDKKGFINPDDFEKFLLNNSDNSNKPNFRN
jgi:hypothetical protein